MSAKETPEQRAERITAELRDAVREAAGVLKDLRSAMKEARGQVDEYCHGEVQKALDQTTQNVVTETARMVREHERKVTDRVIGFAALIENNFSREALIREAANRIEKLVMKQVDLHNRRHITPAPEVVISVCDRPHAD